MNRRIIALVVVVCALLAALGGIAVASGFIYLSAPVGDQGTFAVLGSSAPVFSSNADHTASQAEYAGGSLYVTSAVSLTATRKLTLPLVPGESKDIYNGTTGGQSITVGGATGAVATLTNATLSRVTSPDGVNYYAISGGGFDAAAIPGILPMGAGFFIADGAAGAYRAIIPGDLTDAMLAPPAIGAVAPAAGTFTTLGADTIAFNSGHPPGWGRIAITYGSDANKTLSSAEYANHEISVSGTQTFRQLVFPLTGCSSIGCEWVVTNNTLLPFLAIGATGTGVWIAGASADGGSNARYIRSNGTDILDLANAVGKSAQRNYLGTDGGASVVMGIGEDMVCQAQSTSITVCTSVSGGAFTDAASWVTVASYTPAIGEFDDFYVLFEAHDQSGNSNGTSVNGDAAGGGGFYPVLNFDTFKLEAHANTLALLADVGPGAATYLCAQAGSPCNQTATASLAPLAITACAGCTKPYDTTGCVCGATTTFTAQATMSGAQVQIQVKATGTVAWPRPWKAKAYVSFRSYP